ncbi:MAG: hypothetical protein KKA79_03150 [Nanoarchaeota archaeon]|nr:hypothetical protein [Nanoarchaeota archaeon]MCG2717651.1 hypothetical protein [Nanoarchaeota archaeon]
MRLPKSFRPEKSLEDKTYQLTEKANEKPMKEFIPQLDIKFNHDYAVYNPITEEVTIHRKR